MPTAVVHEDYVPVDYAYVVRSGKGRSYRGFFVLNFQIFYTFFSRIFLFPDNPKNIPNARSRYFALC